MTVDPIELAVPGVRGLQPYEPGKPVDAVMREYGVSEAVKLASNENPLGPSPSVLQALAAELSEVGRYPDGGGFRLRERLAERHGVAPERITLGNGSNDILDLAARVFAGPADEIVFSQYAFAIYSIVAQAVGARRIEAPARDYGHDLEAMAACVTPRTRLVFIANPNNPTGTWVGVRALESFLSKLPSHVLVLVDEAYFEYVNEPDYPDASAWVDRFPNLIVTRTFSKAFGLAGLRVGYSISGAAVADLLNRVRQPFNVSSLGQTAALAALGDREHIARSVRFNRDGMVQLISGLRELGLDFIPSVGNFICADLGRPAQPVFEALLSQGIIVRPVASYGMPTHLRISVGKAQENERLLERLAAVLRDGKTQYPASQLAAPTSRRAPG